MARLNNVFTRTIILVLVVVVAGPAKSLVTNEIEQVYPLYNYKKITALKFCFP